ncbi:MAG TPA: hypothetical protein VLH08_09485 [Acidobacteriota bacterium]|nr:hypothetical protein [Acidobacteriota bacterium]
MSTRGKGFLCFLLLLFIAATTQAYEVILKNGKTVKGTLVSEDDSKIVIRDSDGVQINIKKINVDNEKTKTANPTPAPAAAVEQLKPTEPASPVKKSETKQAPKKAATKLTEEDLKKLREKYDLGEGTFKEGTAEESEVTKENSESETDDFSVESEAQWHALAQKHRDQVKAAEERYVQLAQQCDDLKKITVQTHVLVDEQGNELQMNETTQQMCEMADSARVQLEQQRSDLEEFMNEAKEKAVPPGWLRDEEGKDPSEQ